MASWAYPLVIVWTPALSCCVSLSRFSSQCFTSHCSQLLLSVLDVLPALDVGCFLYARGVRLQYCCLPALALPGESSRTRSCRSGLSVKGSMFVLALWEAPVLVAVGSR